MCVVSAIHDYGMRQPYDWWDHAKMEHYKRLLEQAKEFDRKTNQPDCVDPQKEELMKLILKRLDDIEKKLDAQSTPKPNTFTGEFKFEQPRTGDMVEIAPTFIGPRTY